METDDANASDPKENTSKPGTRKNLAGTHLQSTHRENKYQTKSLSDRQPEFPDDWHWEEQQDQISDKIIGAREIVKRSCLEKKNQSRKTQNLLTAEGTHVDAFTIKDGSVPSTCDGGALKNVC